MIKFEEKYFNRFPFSPEQIKKNPSNALRDLQIARTDKIPEVKFNYSYSALIKSGIALVSFYGFKVKSAPGHHIKIIDALAKILRDEGISDMGNAMRSKRNFDFYDGGVEITEKECRAYLIFVENSIEKVRLIISK